MPRIVTYGLLIAAGIGVGLWLNQDSLNLAALLPYVVLLLCPLMMLGMMGGHGHGGHNQSSQSSQPRKPDEHDD
jgi:hypothetical protein